MRLMEAYIAAFWVCVAAANTRRDLTSQLLPELPKCALPCILVIFTDGSCTLDNIQPCLCNNVGLQLNLSTCVQTSCPFADQVATANLETSFCADYPKQSRSKEVMLTGIVCSVIVLPIVLLRFYARLLLTRRLWLDDYMTLIATLVLVTLAGLSIAYTYMGFGMHYWNVDPERGDIILQIFWANQILYVVIQLFSKLAILFFFDRIFENLNFHVVSKVFTVFIVVSSVIFCVIDFVQCLPVKAIWNLSITDRKCVDLNALGYSIAGFSIGEDIFLLFISVPWLVKLPINWKKRIGVCFLFGLGSLACITSMIRLKYLVALSRTYDMTWDVVDAAVWSIIELFSALLCGSLPALWPLATHFAPGLLSRDRTAIEASKPSDSSRPSYNMPKFQEFNGSYDILRPGMGNEPETPRTFSKYRRGFDDIEQNMGHEETTSIQDTSLA